MNLLLDMGNTRLKWALADSGSDAWVAHGACDWSDAKAAMVDAWRGLSRPSRVLAASVVDESRERQVDEVLGTLFKRRTEWIRTPASACGVTNAYAAPSRLGIDRFLAMVAAHHCVAAPAILVSAGTAVTLDALGRDGRHLGGLIAPGPQLMQQSLLQATARVRPERAGAIVELADNTADAVASGAWHAVAALVDRFAERMTMPLGNAAIVLLDGGDADMLMPLLATPAQRQRDGVLRGLAIWAAAHPQDATIA